MRLAHLLALTLATALPIGAAVQPASFEGAWAVTVECPAVADAAGYTLRFPSVRPCTLNFVRN